MSTKKTIHKRIVFRETGEVRPPLAGEWFRGNGGQAVEAMNDFQIQRFPILTMSIEDDSDASTDGGAT